MHAPVDSDFLSQLNEQQREAVLSTEGPLLILAGAGSGKTRVIAHRIAYLIAEKKVPFWNILAVTFTNKAADEMRQRVQRLLHTQERSSLPLVSTFHSLCVRILRQDVEKLNDKYTRRFTIYDQDDSIRLIKGCIRDLGFDEKYVAPRATQSAISSAKNHGEDPTAFTARAEYQDERRAAMAKVYEMYEARLHGNNALDFDDLLIKTVRLLRDVDEIREKYNNKFRYILVDEYQHTNSLQFALNSLITQKTQNIAVVGDEDQSIYKWRGADISNILNFEKHFPKTKTIRLEQNYRSTQTILDIAGAVVKNNLERKGKNLWTSNPRGSRVGYYQAFDAEAEARWVAQKIVEHRREERDILAYLKLALNPNDSIALGRVINSPPRGIGKTTIDELERRGKDYEMSSGETISNLIEQPGSLGPRAISALKSFRGIINKLAKLAEAPDESSKEPVSEIVRSAIIETGYEAPLRGERTDEAEARLENLQELVNAAVDYDEQGVDGLREFIDHSALVSDQDQYKRDAPVTLMTAHSAKGLEFPLVFIVGLEDGLFPHSRSATDRSELEEERGLAYVAMTRAERYLYVTHAMKRRVYGEELASEPSPFLNEMPIDLLEDLSLGKSWLSFARGSSAIDYEQGEYKKERKKYTGKTYDSADSIAEFFKQRNRQMGQAPETKPAPSAAPQKSVEFT